MYSLLNGDTYSNDQKQSVLKFRLIPDLRNRQGGLGGGVERMVQNQKGSKCYSQDQYLWYASGLLTAFLCHRHATFPLPLIYFTGSPSLIAWNIQMEEKGQSILLSRLLEKDSRAWKNAANVSVSTTNSCGQENWIPMRNLPTGNYFVTREQAST